MSTFTSTKQEKRFAIRGSWWINILFVAFALVVAYYLFNLIIYGKCAGGCVVGILSQSLVYATPIAFAAMTGLLCERSGIVNIGIEGQMLMASMVGYAVNVYAFQALQHIMDPTAAGNISRWMALLCGVLATVLLGLLLAVVSIKYKVDQIIGGTVINILSAGVTGYFYRQFLASDVPPGPGTFPVVAIPGLSQIPVIGPILFDQKPLTYTMLVLVFFVFYMLFYTPWGLRVRSVGEHPRAADTLGVNVNKTRYISVVLASVVAGLGGVWFTLEAVDTFSPNMTNGLGFIGLAAMIFGKWNPLGALAGALIFGLGSSVTSILAIYRPDIPSQIPQMLPYVLTIIVLTGVVGRAIPPAAENTPYEKQ